MCGAKSANLLRTWMGAMQTLLRTWKGDMQIADFAPTCSGDIVSADILKVDFFAQLKIYF